MLRTQAKDLKMPQNVIKISTKKLMQAVDTKEMFGESNHNQVYENRDMLRV